VRANDPRSSSTRSSSIRTAPAIGVSLKIILAR
jgi:hypothetical protein